MNPNIAKRIVTLMALAASANVLAADLTEAAKAKGSGVVTGKASCDCSGYPGDWVKACIPECRGVGLVPGTDPIPHFPIDGIVKGKDFKLSNDHVEH